MYPGMGEAIAGVLSNMMGGYKNPADAGSKYYQQIPGELKHYFGPYVQAGNNALSHNLPQLEGEYGNMVSDPSGEQNAMGAGFKQSPGYHYQLNQAMTAANNAAAAGGNAGSPEAMQYAEKQAQGLASQDYNNFMNRDMQLHSQGLSGQNSLFDTLYGGGLQASQGLGENIARALMSQGNLAQASAQNENERRGGMYGSIGALAGLASSFL